MKVSGGMVSVYITGWIINSLEAKYQEIGGNWRNTNDNKKKKEEIINYSKIKFLSIYLFILQRADGRRLKLFLHIYNNSISFHLNCCKDKDAPQVDVLDKIKFKKNKGIEMEDNKTN